MRTLRCKPLLWALAFAMLAVGFVYTGIASVRLYRGILRSPAGSSASFAVDPYLAAADIDGEQLRRAVADAGWLPTEDVVLLAPASAMSAQDRQRVYFSIAYVLYPIRVWLETMPEAALSRRNARRVILVGRDNPFGHARTRNVSQLISLVDLK